MNELINEAKNGNENSYMMLIESVKSILYRVSKSRLENEDDIYEAIDNTVYMAYKNLSKLKKNEYFKTWIIRILINECNKVYKKNQKHRKYSESLDENKLEKESSVNPIDEVVDKMTFEALIEKLNDKEKIVFVLYFYANYKIPEISKILKKSPNTIKSQLTRGKEKLAKYLKEEGDNEYDKL